MATPTNFTNGLKVARTISNKPAQPSQAYTFQGGARYTNHGGVTYTASAATRGATINATTNTHLATLAGTYTLPPGAVEQSTRKVSCTIIAEELLGTVPQPDVKYVDVPTYEEVVKHVPVKEVREVERRVPRVEVEYVEKIVEVPEIQYVQKTVEVPKVQEVVRHIPKIEIVDRPFEVVKEVPRIETKIVERTVEVPGEIIEVPKPYTVETKVPVANFKDTEQALIVAQSVHPIIAETTDVVDVDAVELVPEVKNVDVHMAKLFDTKLIRAGEGETHHRVVTVSSAQYNSMLKWLNGNLRAEEQSQLPFLQENGAIPFMTEQVTWTEVPTHLYSRVEGYQRGKVYSTGQRVLGNQHLATTYVSGQAYKSSARTKTTTGTFYTGGNFAGAAGGYTVTGGTTYVSGAGYTGGITGNVTYKQGGAHYTGITPRTGLKTYKQPVAPQMSY